MNEFPSVYGLKAENRNKLWYDSRMLKKATAISQNRNK